MGIFDDLVPGAPTDAPGAPDKTLRLTVSPSNMTPAPGGHFDDLVPDIAMPRRGSAPSRPVEAAPGAGAAAALGAGSGATANFLDELHGVGSAIDAQPDWLGRFAPPVGIARLIAEGVSGSPGETTKAYQAGRDKVRQAIEAAQAEHPAAYRAGEVGGALATLPLTGELNVARGMGIGARTARASATGAAYGGVSGAGEGEGAADTLAQGAKGAVVGAGAGLVAAPVIAGIANAGGRVAQVVRGVVNPEAEAARRVGTALGTDSPGVAQPMAAAAHVIERGNTGGVPLVLADTGGETTRALARSSANTSPEGRQALQEATGPRFQNEADRFEQTIGNLTGRGTPDAVIARDQLEALARQQNRPAYARAYAAGDRPVISPELERLMGHPDVEDAMRSAVRNGKGYAINEGHGGFNSRVEVTPDGRVNFGSGASGVPTYPNVQYWDYVQRELSNAEGKAVRSGANTEATRIGGARRALNAELDNIVPQFGDARRGAATFFGADNALEAGQNFVRSTMENTEARQAMARMSPAERQLFSQGFASDLVKSVREVPMADRATLISKAFLNSPASRERMEIALGPDGARRIETFLRLERMMDQTRFAVAGNSTTVRQLAEAGLAGGVGGGLMTGDMTGIGPGAIVGAIVRHGAGRINGNVATQVGRLLSSNDPDAIRQAAQLAVRNPALLDTIRRADAALTRGTVPNLMPGTPRARADEQGND